MPRSAAIVRSSLVAALITLALVGCASTPKATPTGTCDGRVLKVLLGDNSSTNSASFDANDVPKLFAISATPMPTCFYKTITTPGPVNGISYTVTHRTLLYIGLSDADAKALVAALRKTTSVAPWSVEYDDGAPAAAPSTASPSPVPVAVSSSALWQYDSTGPTTDVKGEMGYYFANPITDGTAAHAGLSSAVNVVRVETELREPR